MLYKFREIFDSSIYDRSKVIFVCGSYPIFTNIVSETAKKKSRGLLEITEDTVIGDEFGETTDSGAGGLNLTFDDFMAYVRTPSLFGRWFSLVQYKLLTAKQKEKLNNYIRKPNENGLMVVMVDDFKDVRNIRKNNVINKSQEIALFNLNYPPRDTLISIVTSEFDKHGIVVERGAVDYFILRMSEYYDTYPTEIDNIVVKVIGNNTKSTKEIKVSTKDMKGLLRGTENFMFNDFVMRLTKPVTPNSKKVYKMLDSMVDSLGYVKLRRKLLSVISKMVMYRQAINAGYIPVNIRYSAKEAKEALGEKHPLCRDNDILFKKNAYLASQTSLKDWYFMLLILSNTDNKKQYDDAWNLKMMLALINRSLLSTDRLMNALGIKNTLAESLYDLNTYLLWDYMDFTDDKKAFEQYKRKMDELAEKEILKEERKKEREAKKLAKEKAEEEDKKQRAKLKKLYIKHENEKLEQHKNKGPEIWSGKSMDDMLSNFGIVGLADASIDDTEED